MPVLEEARVQHDEDAPDVARAVAIQVECAFRGIEILRGRPVALAVEEFHGDQGVEEITDATRMQTQLSTEFRASGAAMAQLGEHTELDRGEEDLGGPEGEGRLQNLAGIELWARGGHQSYLPISTEWFPVSTSARSATR